MKYFIIGDEDAVLGFGLAGVQGRVARTAQQTNDAFEDALADEETGIIIMTERAADMIRTVVDAYVFSERFPLIVEIPDRRGMDRERPGIRDLVNTAIGIKL